MKYLTKVPFIRIWANLFIFKGKENRKDYTIDLLLWLVIALPLLIAAIVLHYKIVNTNYAKYDILSFCIVWLFFRIPLLAMSARRLRDSDNSWKLCFLIFLPFGYIWAADVCISAKSKEEAGENYQRTNRKIMRDSKSVLAILFVVTLPARLLFYAFLFIDIPFSGRDEGKFVDISEYESYRNKIKYAEEGLPSLDEIGDYTEVLFGYRKVVDSHVMGFVSYGLSLFVDYDVSQYSSAKQFSESHYNFITVPIIQDDGDYTFPVAEFSYDGYEFKIAYTSASVYRSTKEEHIYPKSFTMVGFDDKNNSIAFLYYYNFDLDVLCFKDDEEEYKNGRMQKLIEEEFYWR